MEVEEAYLPRFFEADEMPNQFASTAPLRLPERRPCVHHVAAGAVRPCCPSRCGQCSCVLLGRTLMHRASEGWYVLTVSRTRHCTACRPRQRSGNGTVLTGPFAFTPGTVLTGPFAFTPGTVLTGPFAFTPRLAALLRNAASAARGWIQLPEWRLRGVGDPAVVATE